MSSSNRLIHETSPYLLQHAHHPVDWYPWKEEAFVRARQEERPIFLSIVYSTCHWCHVMAHESFEDAEIARMLNETFICIKVDREERPDIDQVYMEVCQAMTGSGGWPLTIFLTPEKDPFFAATYLPRDSRSGQVGLLDLLPAIKERWMSQREDLRASARDIVSHLQQQRGREKGMDPTPSLLSDAYRALARHYDPVHGGFGGAPKFPSPHQLLFLLRYWNREKSAHALRMVETTLHKMRFGGIYDQVGFGFHRYSVDPEWRIPHFEKMLYDQGLLALAYLECYQVTGDPWYADTAREIFTYVLRDLQSDRGGFYAAEDADSEGVEGKFYVWTPGELSTHLEGSLLEKAREIFHLSAMESSGVAEAKILYRTGEPVDPEVLEAVRIRLFEARTHRVRPHRDTKILTDWNGLMIAALAVGGRILSEPGYLTAAKRAAERLLSATDREGRIFHTTTEAGTGIPGFADDYATLAWGLLELYESTFQPQYLEQSMVLMDALEQWFGDEEEGGYFFTPEDQEAPLGRRKEWYDGATPAGNAIAFHTLLRLEALTGRLEYRERAYRLWNAVSLRVQQMPTAHIHVLSGTDLVLGPVQEIVIAGDLQEGQGADLIRTLRTWYLPRTLILHLSGGDEDRQLRNLAPFTEAYPVPAEGWIAYVCSGHQCTLPSNDPAEILSRLGQPK